MLFDRGAKQVPPSVEGHCPGVLLDIPSACARVIEHKDKPGHPRWRDSSGRAHIQILADACRGAKGKNMCNIAARALHEGHYYEALTALKQL